MNKAYLFFIVSFVLLVLSLYTAFDVRISKIHFEDGSGRIALTYCVPGEWCEQSKHTKIDSPYGESFFILLHGSAQTESRTDVLNVIDFLRLNLLTFRGIRLYYNYLIDKE